jgi:hypothetical protein
MTPVTAHPIPPLLRRLALRAGALALVGTALARSGYA